VTVAGSDSGGGAGIQADINTIGALGCYAMTAITAVTVQNTTGVQAVHAVPAEIVRGQIEAVLSDIGADAVKTGMLVSAAIVNAVADALAPYCSDSTLPQGERRIPLVVDTVMIAKGGRALLDDAGVEAMKRRLFPMARLITPNAPEAARFTGLAIETAGDLARAGEALLRAGARAVLVKGGHVAGATVTDVLVDETGVECFQATRIESKNTHGTGCTLASGIAAGLAQGLPLRQAVIRARSFVQEAICAGLPLGRGTGPVNPLHGR
jgi:hydroxymethylpyrimidine/phosphomethylpyrimidine kinase